MKPTGFKSIRPGVGGAAKRQTAPRLRLGYTPLTRCHGYAAADSRRVGAPQEVDGGRQWLAYQPNYTYGCTVLESRTNP